MRSFISFLLTTVFAAAAFGQIKVMPLSKNDIPASIKYSGHIVNSVYYNDKDGEHIVITTETGDIKVKDDDFDGRRADLFAYNYLKKDNKLTLVWDTHDFVNDCPVDINANFIPKTFAITDLNNDNVAEVWLMYKVVCRGDVSPATMKIIMHEGKIKYAVRGTNKVRVSEKTYYGGEYKLDPVFNTGPTVFKQYATQLWKNNIMETWK